ncbi:DUF3369 domain-containing protein [Nisaea acidiphila]|uniref:DUF3369 domain-containing protein n=1 Tax=Nisaea acidiphila TaxID=1862145 RepID=A0A9J7AWF8_9PROT|nr:DUF3369 domain-containing protein [Nisaea acidiphila]UUX51695.1 DUF3369 domain-containing protein [Nisaea acidiphila]
MTNNDDLLFSDEEADSADGDRHEETEAKWKIVIVDDDPGIHDVTKLTLADFEFSGRGLSFISCYSGAEAREVLAEHPDSALILLDVVMENEHAGLDVAQYIRHTLDNWQSRIVLRTGQPGQAPERKVITEYDINDYKEKTDLTATKLYTLLCSSLRSYRDIVTIDQNRRGLEQVIKASANIFELKSMNEFATGTLEQLTALLHFDPSAVYLRDDVQQGGLAATYAGETLRVLAATGAFKDLSGDNVRDHLSPAIVERLEKAVAARQSLYEDGDFVGFFEDRHGTTNLTYMSGVGTVDPVDRSLLEMFIQNVSIAFENVQLHEDVADTQREIVYMLGEAVETRSEETGNHVKRVAEISRILAEAYGLDEDNVELIKLASPLHDIGKIGVPDAVLNKPGKLDPDEWAIMKAHAELGHKMLSGSNRKIFKAAAIIAHEHHEKWDGSGYPNGKKGEDIHIFGRLTAIADVFDALGSERAYKQAWPLERIVDLMQSESGRHFDPRCVELLMDRLDDIASVRDRFMDQPAARA